MKFNKLLIYRNFEDGNILENIEDKPYECINKIIELANNYGFEGNLWHTFLTFLLVTNQNGYSLACELTGDVDGSINQLVYNDFKLIKKWFEYDLAMGKALKEYKVVQNFPKLINSNMCNTLNALAVDLAKAPTVNEFKNIITNYYKQYGVGQFGLYKAFRFNGKKIVPVTNTADVKLDDLIGYEIQKAQLIRNTEAFLEGHAANNCLLFGEAGTGKSTSIKAILNQYCNRGLRIIEVYKHQFVNIHEVLNQIKNRQYKFIIYMDDLSFEDFETEYKYLKSVIEGGLEYYNVLIYATSNRRNLIREEFNDRTDVHVTDTLQEKVSLVSRFGELIYFGKPNLGEFNEMVRTLAIKNNLDIADDELIKLANAWEIS
ncbi:MAG: AAA family ATPase, partial [Epulopiscium sp. Nele67-Bin001]